MLVNSFEIQSDFWKINPDLSKVAAFTKVQNNFKDHSKLMWMIALIYDYESKYYNYPIKDRIRVVNTDLFSKKPEFNPRERAIVESAIKRYKEMDTDSERRYLDLWNSKVDEFLDCVQTTKITMKNIKEMGEHLLMCDKLIKQKDYIDERVKKKEEEKNKHGLRSGGKLSILEQESI